MTVSVHHSLPGRVRIHYDLRELTPRQAILAQSLIAVQDGIIDISVNTQIGSYLIIFDTSIISQKEIEDVTKRVSYGNLARKLLISDEPVHILENDEEKTIPAEALKKGDLVIVRQGSMIPCDGTVESGEGMVNQASITGESLPVDKKAGSGVFAGTILSEGELIIRTRSTGQDTKVQNIIQMIDNSQSLKANVQRRSENLAEKIVPFNFALAGLTWLFTRNVTKTMSTLMVDYSCAMKLAAPIAVLSAMKEAAGLGISVKGGKYLEEVAQAHSIIFDKTGTLTYANPVVEKIYSFQNYTEDFVLQTAACLEEHFPHPLGRAVVTNAEKLGLYHPENHTKVEYIVAHGIASTLDGKKIRIGSAHFIFDDEKIPYEEGVKAIQEASLKTGQSLLYLSYDNHLAGVLAIGDPVRPEAREVIQQLKSTGIRRCVMITGDTEGAAKKIAAEAGLDGYYSQALPEDKVSLIKKEKKQGKIIMLGDGINDAPALSAADVGIAIEGSSSIASDTADIVLSGGGLSSVVTTRLLGQGLISKINQNNAFIIEVNSALLILGVMGLITPQLAAILHNSVTVGISMKSMQNILG